MCWLMSDSDKKNKKVAAVEKVLGEPFFGDFPENALKVRRNLVILSVILIAINLGGIQINSSSTFLGLRFDGLNSVFLLQILSYINLYLLIHFSWCAFDSILEWKIRITGTRLAFVTTARLSSEDGDYPNDARQSTMYSWWIAQAKKIGNLKGKIETIESQIKVSQERLDKAVAETDSVNMSNLSSSVLQTLNNALTATNDLKHSVETAQKAIASQRIPVSLQRFDNWFQFLLRSQNLRWLIIEFVFPIILGGSALFLNL